MPTGTDSRATFYRDCTPESAARQFVQATYGPKWRAIRMGQPYRDLGRPGAFFPALYEDGRMVTTLPAFKVEGTYRRRENVVRLLPRDSIARVASPGSVG